MNVVIPAMISVRVLVLCSRNLKNFSIATAPFLKILLRKQIITEPFPSCKKPIRLHVVNWMLLSLKIRQSIPPESPKHFRFHQTILPDHMNHSTFSSINTARPCESLLIFIYFYSVSVFSNSKIHSIPGN